MPMDDDTDRGLTTTIVIAAVLVLVALAFGLFRLVPRSDGSALHPAVQSAATGADAVHPHHPAGSVADRLRAAPEQLAFCVSASLEPFDVSLQQLGGEAAGEVVERFRRCLLDTLLDHADDATVAELETHRPHFTSCFLTLPGYTGTKAEAVAATANCINVPPS